MIADLILKIIFGPKNMIKKGGDIIPEKIREILIIRTAYVGDILMTLPILKPLKEKFSDSRITFLCSTTGSALLLNNPYIDSIITHDPFWFYPSQKKGYFNFIKSFKKKHYDLIIEARGDIRDLLFLVFPIKAKYKISYNIGGGGDLLTHVVPYEGLKHKVEYHLDLVRYLGCNINKIDWDIYLTDEEKEKVAAILKNKGINSRFVAIHPGARLPLKRWPGERFSGLCDLIMEKYSFPLVLLGTHDEEELAENIISNMKKKPISLAGQTSLRELAGILSQAEIFVCNDSAPMHIAAIMKTPTVAIFGPSKSIETKPYGNLNRVVEKEFPCRSRCDESSCGYQVFHACMKAIVVEDVFEKVENILEDL